MERFRRVGHAAIALLALVIPATASAQVPAFGAETPPGLGQLLSAVYAYSLQLVGLAVFGMFLYAGLKLMLPGGSWKESGKIMQDAVVGAVLLFSAYVILNTINPDYVRFTPGEVPDLSPNGTTGGGTQ